MSKTNFYFPKTARKKKSRLYIEVHDKNKLRRSSFVRHIPKCSICGEKVTPTDNMLFCSFNNGDGKDWQGSRDLDFRPPPNLRYALGLDICVCPNCGYVSSDLTKPVSDELKTYVLSENYIKPDSSSREDMFAAMLDLALRFEAEYDHALDLAIKLAWICDDKMASDKAVFYRKIALKILTECQNKLTIDQERIACLLADLYRRCREFSEVQTLCREFKTTDEYVMIILEYQYFLAIQKDARCHTLDEAEKYDRERAWRI